MPNFLSRFHYDPNLLMSISIGSFDSAQFYKDIPDIPSNIDVWFSPALRSKRGNHKEDVHGTIALWVDVDDTQNAVQATLPPSCIVNSGGGYHVYYFLRAPCTDIDRIETTNKLLAEDIQNGDVSCWNINRILRVPETLNTKAEYDPPRRVKIVEYDPTIVYDIEDFTILDSLTSKIKHKIRTGDRRGHKSRSERDWGILRSLFIAGASEDLVRLIFQHKPCGDKAREEPTYFSRTLAKAKETVHESEATKKERAKSATVTEGPDGLYLKGRRMTTFILEPVLLLDGHQFESEDAIVCDVRAEGHEWKGIAFPKSAFTSVSQMDKHTGVAAWQFLGSEPGLRAILPYLMEKLQAKGLPRVIATPTLGLHKIKDRWLFLGDKQTLSADEMWEGFEGPLAWLTTRREHPEQSLNEIQDVGKFQTLMRLIPQLNQPETIWPIIGWYTMASLKPAIEECNYRFPILNITGTRGSGKTTLILRVFMKMFGQPEPKSYDAGTTRFVTLALLGSSNAVPIAFSEFRVDSVQNFIRYILLAYDTGHDPRGRADQTTVDYPLSAPFSIDGEDLVDDPAAQERIVVSVLRPKAIDQTTNAYQRMQEFVHTFDTNPGGWIIQTLLKEIPNLKTLIGTSFDEMMHAFPESIPDRIRRNYTLTWTGIKLWCKMAEMECPDIEVLRESIHVLYDTKIGRSRVAADSLVEDLANAANGGSEAFKFVANKHEFWFQLASGHNYWIMSKRRQGRSALERVAIRNQLKEAPYFIGQQAMDGVWMMGINLEKAFELGLDLPREMTLGVVTFHTKG